jgi:hypothetical protein
MRTLKGVNFGKKYFISNRNDISIFKDIDKIYYTAVWSVNNGSYCQCPQHPYRDSDGFKCFRFGESEFQTIREYHINNELFSIDYEWLKITFNLKNFRYE